MQIIMTFTELDIDECETADPCDSNAVCTDTVGSFTCACNTGFMGDGLSCQSKHI